MMKKFLTAAFACALFCSCSAAAGEVSRARSEVWQKYLAPAEQAVLALLASAPEKPAPPPDASPADVLEMERRGFAAMMAAEAPPVRGVAGRQFSEDGVRGVWFYPRDPDPRQVVLYFHGGGFLAGSPETGASLAGFLAKEMDTPVFALQYPLAPESPYPAQLDSAVAAYTMLLNRGHGPRNIVVAGDSAGGNLATALLLSLRDRGMPMPAAAYLISPWVDLTHSSDTHAKKAEIDFSLDEATLRLMADSYLQGHDATDPLASPVKADLRGLPPLLIQVGSFEILLDDSLTLARNAALADVPVRLSVWPGYGHDFQAFHGKLRGGAAALEEGANFLEKALEGELLTD